MLMNCNNINKDHQIVSPNEEYVQYLVIDDVPRLKKSFDEIDRSGFPGFYHKKASNINRNFDDTNVSGFQGFVKKNFDEIDSASAFRGFDKKNFDEIDRSGFNDFGKRNFDEIDASGFRGFDKKSVSDSYDFDVRNLEKYHRLRVPSYLKLSRIGSSNLLKNNFDVGATKLQKKNFDEIDRVGFPGFNKRF